MRLPSSTAASSTSAPTGHGNTAGGPSRAGVAADGAGGGAEARLRWTEPSGLQVLEDADTRLPAPAQTQRPGSPTGRSRSTQQSAAAMTGSSHAEAGPAGRTPPRVNGEPDRGAGAMSTVSIGGVTVKVFSASAALRSLLARAKAAVEDGVPIAPVALAPGSTRGAGGVGPRVDQLPSTSASASASASGTSNRVAHRTHAVGRSRRDARGSASASDRNSAKSRGSPGRHRRSEESPQRRRRK